MYRVFEVMRGKRRNHQHHNIFFRKGRRNKLITQMTFQVNSRVIHKSVSWRKDKENKRYGTIKSIHYLAEFHNNEKYFVIHWDDEEKANFELYDTTQFKLAK
jgi:hypothetical protein